MTLGIQYKRSRWEQKAKEKKIRKAPLFLCFSKARSKGTKKTKARNEVWVFGKARP